MPAVTSRLIASYDGQDLAEPVRIDSDSTGGGKMASITFLYRSTLNLPVALKSSADEELNTLAASTNPINICELFATAAPLFQTRGHLAGKRAIIFVDNDAACSVLAKGTAKNKGARVLVDAVWDIAAQRDIGLWTERVPTDVNPADLPPRDRDLPLETEKAKELVFFKDTLSIYDCSWWPFSASSELVVR